MIVRFSISPEGLKLSDVEHSRKTNVIRRIVHTWADSGRLIIMGGEKGKEGFLNTVKELRTDERKLWQSAIKKFRLKTWETDFHTPASAEHLQTLGARCEVYAVSQDELDTLVAECGLMPPQIQTSTPYVNLLGYLDESKPFSDMREIFGRPIPTGTSTIELWKTRFDAITKESKEIVIVDRYCAIRLLKSRYSSEPSGLEFFLRNSEGPDPKHVQLFCALDDKKDMVPLKSHLDFFMGDDCRNSEITLTINVLPSRYFSSIAHDRFIIFDKHVVELGPGMEIFEGPTVKRNAQFTLKRMHFEHKIIIREMKSETKALNTSFSISPD